MAQTDKSVTKIPIRTEMTNLGFEMGASDLLIVASMETNGEGGELEVDVYRHNFETHVSKKCIPDFEETLKDIDDDILNGPTLSNSKTTDPEIPRSQIVSSCNLIDISVMEDDYVWENQTWNLNGKLLDTKVGGMNNKVEFRMGWIETGLVGVKDKKKPNKSGSKGKPKLRPISGPMLAQNKVVNKGVMGLSEGTWKISQSPCTNACTPLRCYFAKRLIGSL